MADAWEQRYRCFVSKLDREISEVPEDLRGFRQNAKTYNHAVQGCKNVSDICDRLEKSCTTGCRGAVLQIRGSLMNAELRRYLPEINGLVAEVTEALPAEDSSINPDNKLAFVRIDKTKTIAWSQNMRPHSQTYDQCTYTQNSGQEVTVFVQSSFGKPEQINLDNNLQYGLKDRSKFYVLHDKSQKPFQHRFVENPPSAHLLNIFGAVQHMINSTVGEFLQDIVRH